MANNRFSRLLKILTGAEGEMLRLEGRVEHWVHFWVLVKRQFVRNRCLVRAEALSYSTLLALIPLLAVALGVTGTLLKHQDEEQIYHLVDSFVAGITPPAAIQTNTVAAVTPAGTNDLAVPGTNTLPAVAGAEISAGTNAAVVVAAPPTDDAQKEIAKQIRAFVQKTSGSALGVTGSIMLVFVAISMLGRIEATFNDIWGVTRGRHWLTQIHLYFAVITLGPLLLVTALGLAGGTYFQAARELIEHTPLVGDLVFRLLPLVMLWLVFALIYLLVPNTRVKFSAALVGGVVGGSLWQLNNLFGFLYVSRVATNFKIYGGLGLVPVLMVGLYFSWCILLFGSQVAYAFQNRAAYRQDRLAENVNQRGREFVALRLMAALGQRFQNGLPPGTVPQLSTGLGVPSRLTQSILLILTNARLVIELAGEEPAYAPARPLEQISCHDILFALRNGNGQELPAAEAPALAEIYGEFARIEKAERDLAGSISLLALVNRVAGVLPAPAVPSALPPAPVPVPEPVAAPVREPEPVSIPAPTSPVVTVLPPVEEPKPRMTEPAPLEAPPAAVAAVSTSAIAQPEEQEFPL